MHPGHLDSRGTSLIKSDRCYAVTNIRIFVYIELSPMPFIASTNVHCNFHHTTKIQQGALGGVIVI